MHLRAAAAEDEVEAAADAVFAGFVVAPEASVGAATEASSEEGPVVG